MEDLLISSVEMQERRSTCLLHTTDTKAKTYQKLLHHLTHRRRFGSFNFGEIMSVQSVHLCTHLVCWPYDFPEHKQSATTYKWFLLRNLFKRFSGAALIRLINSSFNCVPLSLYNGQVRCTGTQPKQITHRFIELRLSCAFGCPCSSSKTRTQALVSTILLTSVVTGKASVSDYRLCGLRQVII